MRVPVSQRLLIVCEERDLLQMLVRHCQRQGFEARGIAHLPALARQLAEFRPDALLYDFQIEAGGVSRCLELLGAARFAGPVFLIGGSETQRLRALREAGRELGLEMAECLAKPFDLEALTDCLRRHLKGQVPLNEEALSIGIGLRQVVAHFQPQIEVASGRLVGAEALARWQHPTLGLVPPLRFIDLAEDAGLMPALTLQILEDAVALIEAWQEAVPELQVSVNVTAPLVTDQSFVAEALRLIADPRVRRAVKLEITESSAMHNSREIEAALTRLRVRGISLAIDDFGTGYSSLVALHRMPFTELKVDQSFVRELDRDGDAKVIVRALIELAHNLGQTVCAEGVETAAALEFLRQRGCDAAQGFHIAEPLAPAAFDDWCARQLTGEPAPTADYGLFRKRLRVPIAGE